MRVILSSKIQNHTYNATENTGCYNASNNDLNSKYVDIFWMYLAFIPMFRI